MKTIRLILLITILFSSFSAYSQITYFWNGGNSGSFLDVTNWLPEGLPVNTDTIVFDNGIPLTVDNVPTALFLGGFAILPSGSDVPTTVHFNFDVGALNINTNGFLIDEACSLNYSDAVDIHAIEYLVFNQASLNIPNGGLFLNSTCISNILFQNTINAIQVNNQGIFNLNNGELILDCIFDNVGLGTLNLNAGTLIVNKELYCDINAFITGGPNANLIISSSATHIDPINEIQLGTFDYNAYHAVQMSGDMIIENYLHMGDGELIIDANILSLNGDFVCEGGLIGGTVNSDINIGSGGNTGDVLNLAFNETDGRNKLKSLIVNREFEIIDINSNLDIFENLTLAAGKIKINNNLFLYSTSNVSVVDTDSYIITGGSGTVTRSLIGGTNFLFPIGTELYYAPISIVPDAADDFIVRVTDSVYIQGYTGQTTVDPRIVHLTWNIETVTDAGPYSPTFSWNYAAQGTDFIQSDAYLSNFDIIQNKWVETAVGTSNVATAGSLSVTDLNVQGLFAVSSILNNPPAASDQTFSILEHSPNGTEVGKLLVSDPDPGQLLTINIVNGPDPDPFDLLDDHTVVVKDSEFLEYSINPFFEYDLEVCDNGMSVLCTPFHVIINLVEDGNDSLIIANYLSPNHDNFNDTWKISGLDLANIDVFIYNNSGNLVYESRGYRNDWDGTSNGIRLPAGVYYYIIRTADFEERGTITLVR